MKILFLDWQSFGNEDFLEAANELGIETERYPFSKNVPRRDPVTEKQLMKGFEASGADFVFSFNYFPIVSTVCNALNKKYVSWVYDSPHVTLYSYTVIQPVNTIYLFDRAEYEKFHRQGISTVHYLPLAANPKRIAELLKKKKSGFTADISFVGSLYSEEQRALLNLKPAPDGVETLEWLKTEYIDNRKLTSEERIALLNIAAGCGETHLFTGSDTSPLDKRIILDGKVDYYDGAPFVYNGSKINLCMTLKSIHTGIPLRVFDILASKGLLLMNRQSDMDEFFVEGEDYYVYDSEEDFKKKIDMLLSRDNSGIIQSAYEKICEKHTYTERINRMF